MNSEVMRRALEYARYHDLAVISHCEDMNLVTGGVMHEGNVSTQIGMPGIPSASEVIMVQRDIALAALTGCRVHIAHVSTSGSVDAIRLPVRLLLTISVWITGLLLVMIQMQR
jgi:dihydroorotase